MILIKHLFLCGADMVAGQKASLSAVRLDSLWEVFGEMVLSPIF